MHHERIYYENVLDIVKSASDAPNERLREIHIGVEEVRIREKSYQEVVKVNIES